MADRTFFLLFILTKKVNTLVFDFRGWRGKWPSPKCRGHSSRLSPSIDRSRSMDKASLHFYLRQRRYTERCKIIKSRNPNCALELPSARGRRFKQPFANNFALESSSCSFLLNRQTNMVAYEIWALDSKSEFRSDLQGCLKAVVGS